MKSSGIGGQAVLEGVMMKNRSQYSVAIRTQDGDISVMTEKCKSAADRSVFFRLPIIRGIVAFLESLTLGMKTLTYSSSFLEEDEEKEQAEHDRRETIENIIVVLVAVVLAVVIFMILPLLLSEVLRRVITSDTALTVLEGAIRVLLFVGYVALISCMSDIRRVFMYHGAEHKTINCVERGLELTVANVRKQSKQHRRCGTSFLLTVMLVSVIVFLFIRADNLVLRMALRVLMIPVIAGISYEFIRLAGNTDNKVVLLLSQPGLWLQRLTTREPDDEMIEVAIASVEAVFDWREYQRKMKTMEERRARRRKQRAAQKAVQVAADGDELTEITEKRKRKTRTQRRKELEERERRYQSRKSEKERLAKEREKKEKERQQKYQDIQRRKEARKAAMRENAPAPKVEEEQNEELSGLDHYFDK